MTWHNSIVCTVGRHALIASAALVVVQVAVAERALDLSFKETSGYGRIVMKWSDGDQQAPRVAASIENQVLLLRFDEEISASLEKLTEEMPNWVSVTRQDPDGKTLRIGLTRESRIHASTSVDLTAIDIVPETSTKDPADIVSPLLAQRLREAEERRLAAIPPPAAIEQLELRGSDSGESSRIAFYWPTEVAYKTVSETKGELQLLFNRRAEVDAAYLKIEPPNQLKGFEGKNTDKGYLVTVQSKGDLPIRTFRTGNVVTIDISPAGNSDSLEETISRQVAEAGIKPAAPSVEPIPTAEVESASLPATNANTPKPGVPGQLGPKTPPPEAHPMPGMDLAEKPDSVGPQTEVLGGSERKTQMSEAWHDPAPPSGVTDVKVGPLSNGVEFAIDFGEPTPAAVFSHGKAVWAVFAANTDLKVDPTALPPGYRVRSTRSQDATYLRIEAPKGLIPSAEVQGGTWTVRLAPSATRPTRFLQPQKRAGDGGRSRIDALMIGAAGIIWIEDPVVGDEIAAIVAYGPTTASPSAIEMVELEMPATSHGLAVVPRSDTVQVVLEGERAVVTLSNRSQSMAAVERAEDEAVVVKPNPAFIDFSGWGGKSGNDWFVTRQALEAETEDLDLETLLGTAALMELARFYLGHEMAYEAIGILQIAGASRPDIELEADYLGLLGAANVMAHRLDRAEELLSKGPLRGDESAALWRGAVAAERGDWEHAADFFRASGDQIYAYPPEKAAEFSAYFAEAAFKANDFDTARKQADRAIENGEGEAQERGQLVLANLASVIEGPEAGYKQFETLSIQASEPIAVRAELGRLELAVAAKKMGANEAASELESLRYRWRGDGVEMTIVGILSDQYMRVGRFHDALSLAQSAALRDASAPGARDLRIRLSDYFRRLYLKGEANRLDPIQALALFYEYSDLTPIGADGDQMIRKLAQRLVAFDLLEPAAQLLQHQVDNRMRGIGKAALAVDLATIYLLDRQPDKALAAINTTRQPSLPRELAYERRKLEAAAYRDLGRYDHVVELMEPLDDMEAKSLLADAFMRDRKWPQASRAYLSMLPPPDAATSNEANIVLKAGIAARMSRSVELLARARAYSAVMAKDPNKASFDLITSQVELEGTALSEAARRLVDSPTVDAFSAAMKNRFSTDPTQGTGGSR